MYFKAFYIYNLSRLNVCVELTVVNHTQFYRSLTHDQSSVQPDEIATLTAMMEIWQSLNYQRERSCQQFSITCSLANGVMEKCISSIITGFVDDIWNLDISFIIIKSFLKIMLRWINNAWFTMALLLFKQKSKDVGITSWRDLKALTVSLFKDDGRTSDILCAKKHYTRR